LGIPVKPIIRFAEMQTRYKTEAGSVCGFPRFVTSAGLGSEYSKIQFWVQERVLGLKIKKKKRFSGSFLVQYRFNTGHGFVCISVDL
jgi:hypothetical protein